MHRAHAHTGLGNHGTLDPTDERVRRTGRDAVPPGDHVPSNGTDQRAEHHVVIHHLGMTMALPTVAATCS